MRVRHDFHLFLNFFSALESNGSTIHNATSDSGKEEEESSDDEEVLFTTVETIVRIPRSAGHTLLLFCLLTPHVLLLAVNATRAILSCTRRLPSARTVIAYASFDVSACVGVGILVFVVAPRLDYVGRIFLGFVGGVAAPTLIDVGASVIGARGDF